MGTQAGLVKPDQLMDWVRAGNTAILFCPYENAHMDGLGINLSGIIRADQTTEVHSTGVYQGQARKLHFASDSRFYLDGSSTPTETLFASGDRPAVLSAPIGSGRFILIADAHPATNLGIAEEDNALFLIEAVESAGGDVIFDETSTRLSLGDPGVMAYARKSGLMPVFLELGVIALLVLWHVAARTAPPISQRSATVPDVPDYVTGRARLYEKALMGRTTVGALTATVRDALHRTAGLSESTKARGAALLERAKGLERLRVPRPREVLDFARSIHDFMNEAIWKPGRRLRAPKSGRWKRR